jgi:hypothetical protein
MMSDRKPFLTISTAGDDESGKSRTEFYFLNPGEVFAGFGGSRSGLLVKKTPSLITRRIDVGWHDVEWPVDDPRPWAMVARAINGEFKATATTQPVPTE